MPLIGYARVSSDGQDTALQMDVLLRTGCTVIYEEKASGASRKGRPVLEKCLLDIRKGDTLVVYKIDRVARSLFDLLDILEILQCKGAMIKSVTEPLDTSSPIGIFTIQMLGAVAQLERAMILERCMAGLQAAKERGQQLGRPLLFDSSDVVYMKQMKQSGLTHGDICALFDCSYHTVYRLIREPSFN